jgi:phosphonate transport system substrate-binding protein
MSLQRRIVLHSLAGLCAGQLLASAVMAQPAAEPSMLVFGLISPRAAAETRANWEPFVKLLGVAIRRPIDLRVYESQGALVTAFIGGEIDLAWMGNVPALDIVASGAGGVFAQMVTQDGSVGYKSILVAHRNSQVHALKSLLENAPGLRFGDGDPKSTSGHLVPLYFAFSKNGVASPAEIFKSVEIGSHQQNLLKVSKKEIDVATANNEELGFFQRDFPDLAREVKVIWESPLIPQSPLLWKATLPDALKASIRKFVLGFAASDPGEKRILLAVNGLSRFRASSNRQLLPIADLEMFKTRQAINDDKALSAAERQARIAQAIERGSRLELRLKMAI